MRLPLLLWLLPPLLSGRGAAAPPTDPPSLPALQNVKLLLYNADQVLSWDPVTPIDGAGPVVYQVQFRFPVSSWKDVVQEHPPNVNCTGITVPTCNLTASHKNAFLPVFYTVSLRVRALQGPHASTWACTPWFQHYRNVTIGPPGDLVVAPGRGSITITFSEPFDLSRISSEVVFQYSVCHWEMTRCVKEEGPFKKPHIQLPNLKPSRLYCVRVRAQLVEYEKSKPSVVNTGSYSNVTCSEPGPDAFAESQRAAFLAMGLFLAAVVPAGLFLFVVLRHGHRLKLWFRTPPGIPGQVEEYLKDPAHPILDFLVQDSSPKDDAWDRVSIVSASRTE